MEDTCVVIKLMSGEEVVGFCDVDDIALNNSDLLLKYPLRIVTMPAAEHTLSISLMKFMPYTDTDVFTINPDSIMIIEPAAEDLTKYYQSILEYYVEENETAPDKKRGKRMAQLAAKQREVMETYALMMANTEPIVYH